MKFTVYLLSVWLAVALASTEEAAEDTSAAEFNDDDKRQDKRGIFEADLGYGYGDYGSYGDAISTVGGANYGYNYHAAPISQTVTVTKPVAVPVVKPVAYPVPQPYAVNVPHPVPVPVKVPEPYAVPVPQPYPVYKTIPVPVEKHIPYPVVKHVPYAVHVPKPYPVHVPVYKHIHHYPKIVTKITTTKYSPKWHSW